MVDGRGTPASNNSLQTENGVPRLRAMGFGEILDTTFSLYRSHFRTFLGIATGYFIAMVIGISISFFDNAMGRDTKVVLWILTFSVISCISIFVVSALVFASVRAYLDGKINIVTVLRQAGRHFFRCLISAIVFGLIVFFLTFLILLVFFGIFRSSVSNSAEAVLIMVLGVFVVLFLAASSFVIYWCFYISAISVEQTTALPALGRSDELIRGKWWRIGAVMVGILLLHYGIGLILRITFATLLTLTGLAEITEFLAMVQWMTAFQFPTSIDEFHLVTALMYLINSGIDALTMPIWVIGCTLLYFDQRIRREGFDIEVMATRRGA